MNGVDNIFLDHDIVEDVEGQENVEVENCWRRRTLKVKKPRKFLDEEEEEEEEAKLCLVLNSANEYYILYIIYYLCLYTMVKSLIWFNKRYYTIGGDHKYQIMKHK